MVPSVFVLERFHFIQVMGISFDHLHVQCRSLYLLQLAMIRYLFSLSLPHTSGLVASPLWRCIRMERGSMPRPPTRRWKPLEVSTQRMAPLRYQWMSVSVATCWWSYIMFGPYLLLRRLELYVHTCAFCVYMYIFVHVHSKCSCACTMSSTA